MSTELQSPPSVTVSLDSELSAPNDKGATTIYGFHWPSVALAALAAATAITIYMMTVPRLLDVEAMDIGITIGAMADPSDGLVAYVVRIAWHVGHGLLYVPFYAAILLWLRTDSSARTGAAFGIFLWLAGPMLLIPLLLNRPRINTGDLSHPGVFMLALGLGWTPAIIDLGAHLIHGILTGVICKHRRPQPIVVVADDCAGQAAQLAQTPEIVSQRMVG